MNNRFGKSLLTGLAFAVLAGLGTAGAEVDEKGREPVAGEVISHTEQKPFVSIEPERDVTDIFSGTSATDEEPDIYFNADELINNEHEKTIEAVGDVVIKRGNMTLYTDKLLYNQPEDRIFAIGHVRMEEESGNVVFADEVELSQKMSQVQMQKIKAILQDESKIWAEEFRKKTNDNKVMRRAVYTPCDFCEGKESPLWQVRARKVTHDAENKNINYNDAFIDIKGVPLFYTPFLSHPDPSVKRRSGFLTPKIGSSNYLGGTFQVNYFWDINPHSDFLFSPIYTTDKDVVLGGRYRQYFNRGYWEMEGSYLQDNEENRPEYRGNLFGYGRYEINDYWVADTNFNYVSDNLYLKELNLAHDDDAWLTSNVRLQRFENRDYASIEAYYYKLISYDLRYRDQQEYERRKLNKPFAVPLAEYEFISDLSPIGSYWKNDVNFASVYHESNVQTQRLSMINSWVLPWISPFGEQYKIAASLKSDAYYIDKYKAAGSSNAFSGDVVRVFPQIGVEWKLPFVKATETTRQIVEPVIVGVLAPNGGNKSNKIPNEDSEDIELDDTNILDLDRYSGYDRNDTGSRVSYGLNWNSYGNIMGRTSAFIAQTYQFNKDSSFSKAVENEGHFSDYVGRVYAAPTNYLDLDYRFRLDQKNFRLKYSELGARIGTNLLNLYVSYIYLEENKTASSYFDERQELYTSLNMSLTRDWSIGIYNRQDLTDKNKGSLEHGGNLIYEDECFKFVSTAKKSNSNNPDLEDNYEFNFSFYLKTLGGLGT